MLGGHRKVEDNWLNVAHLRGKWKETNVRLGRGAGTNTNQSPGQRQLQHLRHHLESLGPQGVLQDAIHIVQKALRKLSTSL